MSFWSKARASAAEEYGKQNAGAFARRERLKSTAGWTVVGLFGLWVTVQTWGPAVWPYVRSGLLYGLGALFVFAGLCTFVYLARRTYKRSSRTYVHGEIVYRNPYTYDGGE